MTRDEEIEQQEAGGVVFWAVVAAVGVALILAGRLGYLDVSLGLFSVSITPGLAGAVLGGIGILMIGVFFLASPERNEEE